MHLLSVALFAACANLDCFVVGLSYGVRRTVIGRLSCLLMCVIAFLGTFCSMVLGEGVEQLIPVQWANSLGGLIILGMGVWGLLLWQKHRKNEYSQLNQALAQLSFRNTILLGVTLAVNNIALGVGAGMSGMSPLWCAASSMLFSFLFLWGGNRLGCYQLTRHVGQLAEPGAAVLMFVLGCYELFI
ncbi:MAG: manganese efflux pump [Lawsonibacter sp.]|nr:manganese efflux pump [Lawsonibacter sp.]